MNGTIEDEIARLQPFEAAKVAEELFDLVYARVPFDRVLENAQGDAALQELIAFGSKDTVTVQQDGLTNELLLSFVREPELEPLVRQALDAARADQTLGIDPVISIGLLINLTLFISTTSFKIKRDSSGRITAEFVKVAASPSLIKNVIQPMIGLVRGKT